MRLLSNAGSFAIFLVLLASSGCSLLPQSDRRAQSESAKQAPDYVNIVRTQDLLIQLIPSDAADGARNDHPAAFTPGQLQALLLSLRVHIEGAEEAVTLAPPAKMEFVSEELAEALSRASAAQDVFLVFFRTRSGSFMFSSQRQVTAARVFFADDQLNLVFSELDSFYSPFRDPQTNPLVPGSRIQAADVDGRRLVEAPNWQWQQGRRDWLQLDATAKGIEVARDRLPTDAPAVSTSGGALPEFGPAADRGKRAQGEPPNADVDPGSMPATPASKSANGVNQVPIASPARPAVKAIGESSDPWQRLETRLQSLKKLRDQGLISEQDYEDKKDELLKNLP